MSRTEREEWEKTCYCYLCEKSFHPLGIMQHRKGHVNRGESGEIEYTNGNVRRFGPRKTPPAEEAQQPRRQKEESEIQK